MDYLTPGALAVVIVLLAVLLMRSRVDPAAGVAQLLRDELRGARDEHATAARALREEIAASTKAGQATLAEQIRESRDGMHQSLKEIGAAQQTHLASVERRLVALTESSAAQQEQLRDRLAGQVRELQEGNEKKLEEMRATVDEKLHATLEKRLGESFTQVSDRLEAVHRGLGEMQALATGVGDLKRALTNVKVRGIWGEYQLQAILEQILNPDQYVSNYKPKDDAGSVVEFAVKLPGMGQDPVYLPIDSKFPQEDYLTLLDAADRADAETLRVATRNLTDAVRKAAKDICDKYVNPPVTTDIAILFLPTEGLYAEVLRQPGLVQEIQAQCHVVLAGPTTLAAILSSFRMGFRTLAIEQRSSEVWQVLGAVKTEFGKFGKVLDTARKQLATAAKTLDSTGARTRTMERRLREVEELPGDLASRMLKLGDGDGAVFAAIPEEDEEAQPA